MTTMDLQASLPPPPPPPNAMHSLRMDLHAPPPPPPPSNAMHSLNNQAPLNVNANQNSSDRSQLLIDIEKGKTLKKVSNAQKGVHSRPLNQMKHVSVSSFRLI